MAKQFELVMFDMDGTFISSREFHTQVFTRFFNGFVMPVEYDEVRKGMGNTVWTIFESFHVSRERFEQLFWQLDGFCRTEILDLVKEITLAGDVKETLVRLKSRCYQTALVTNSMQGVTESILNYFGLSDLFDMVVGADIESATKHARCEKVRESLHCSAVKTVYVGDAETDIQLAMDLGYGSCFADTAISWAKDRYFIYEKMKPDFAIRALKELPECLESSVDSR